jgi:AcrR family transcriptional regulator
MARRRLMSDEEILARARPVFVEGGFAARTKRVAEAVGLTWGALALRFGDKRSLFMRAMAWRPDGRDAPACVQDERADLPELLMRLRADVCERWPTELQVRLASTAADFAQERADLKCRLVSALEAQACRGAVRSDLGAPVLARLVLALVTGDVAQRFMQRDRTLAQDPAFIDAVVRLLSPA